jgi:acyl-CoA thioester hydrolase
MAMNDFYIATKEIQVSYADTDMMGVIYHGNYVKWLEFGRTQLIRDVGYDYLEMEQAGYYAPVYNLEITYKKSITLGDKVFVKTWIEENKGLRTVYGFEIINGKDELCAEGTTTHIVVDKNSFKPVQFKKVFPEWYLKYEEIKKKSNN